MRMRFQQEARHRRRASPTRTSWRFWTSPRTDRRPIWSWRVLPGVTLRDEIVRGPLALPRVRLVMSQSWLAVVLRHTRALACSTATSSPATSSYGDTGTSEDRRDLWCRQGLRHPLGGGTGASDDATLTGVVLGTPGGISAPERTAGRGRPPCNPTSHSVGAVMVEALTGRRAVPGAIPGDLPAPLRERGAPRNYATDPCDRFPSALAMWEELRMSLTEPSRGPAWGAQASARGSLAPPATPPGTRPLRGSPLPAE